MFKPGVEEFKKKAGEGNLIPVYTIGFAFWLLDESLTSSQLMACGLILSGVVLGQSRRRKAPLNAAQEAVE